MYAIIGTRDGEFYHSAVFGFTAGMYIVFDRDKTHLILQQGDDHGVMTLITDTDRSDWELDTKGNGFVSYFAGRRINWQGEIQLTSDDMKFCRAYDNGNPYPDGPWVFPEFCYKVLSIQAVVGSQGKIE